MEEENIFMYIPDITGYTELITMWDSPESRKFVERILQAIVHNNELDLIVSDIMGDAVFFYSTDKIPSVKELIHQTAKIHEAVKSVMRELEDRLTDKDMKECIRNLGLKFIAHLGEGRVSNIDDHSQIIGKAVIESYKLLKNSIPLSDYLLMSDSYFEVAEAEQATEGVNFLSGKDEFEHVGTISYKIYGY